MPCHRRQNSRPHRIQKRAIRPRRFRHEVMQRSMRRPEPSRGTACAGAAAAGSMLSMAGALISQRARDGRSRAVAAACGEQPASHRGEPEGGIARRGRDRRKGRSSAATPRRRGPSRALSRRTPGSKRRARRRCREGRRATPRCPVSHRRNTPMRPSAGLPFRLDVSGLPARPQLACRRSRAADFAAATELRHRSSQPSAVRSTPRRLRNASPSVPLAPRTRVAQPSLRARAKKLLRALLSLARARLRSVRSRIKSAN